MCSQGFSLPLILPLQPRPRPLQPFAWQRKKIIGFCLSDCWPLHDTSFCGNCCLLVEGHDTINQFNQTIFTASLHHHTYFSHTTCIIPSQHTHIFIYILNIYIYRPYVEKCLQANNCDIMDLFTLSACITTPGQQFARLRQGVPGLPEFLPPQKCSGISRSSMMKGPWCYHVWHFRMDRSYFPMFCGGHFPSWLIFLSNMFEGIWHWICTMFRGTNPVEPPLKLWSQASGETMVPELRQAKWTTESMPNTAVSLPACFGRKNWCKQEAAAWILRTGQSWKKHVAAKQPT